MLTESCKCLKHEGEYECYDKGRTCLYCVRGSIAVRWVKVPLCFELGGTYPNPGLITRGPG